MAQIKIILERRRQFQKMANLRERDIIEILKNFREARANGFQGICDRTAKCSTQPLFPHSMRLYGVICSKSFEHL